jgi:nitrogen fixation/metabolism regulation signal transduction histidine kinase
VRGAKIERRADAEALEGAVAAVIANAIEASPDGAAVDVRLEEVEAGGARVVVLDAGPGFSEMARARVPEPFFSTKPGHMGVGLARAERVLAGHGGRLLLGRGAAGGAEVVLEIGRGEACGEHSG